MNTIDFDESIGTLILDEKDVRRLLTMEEVIGAVELAFAEKSLKRVQLPKNNMFSTKDTTAI